MEKINNLAFSQINSLEKEINENILTPEIEDIVEVTYAYKDLKDGTNWNTTLFNKLLNEKYDENIYKKNNENLKSILEKALLKLNNKINNIDEAILSLSELSNLSEDEVIKRDLLEGSLKYARNTLEMALIGLPFELEKAGLKLKLSDEEVESRINKIEELEYKNFGGKISENPEEMGLIYNFMKGNFEDYKNNLNSEEQKEYKNYLEIIYNTLIEKNKDFKYVKSKEKITHPALELKMRREEYVNIFKSIPKILNSDKQVEISKEYSSFYDGAKWFIPGNKDYENKSLEYILSTGVHEGFHLITEMQGDKNVKGAKGAGFLEREEGMAVFLEYLIKGEESLVGLGEPRLLVGELYKGPETERFINLHNKLNPSRKSGNILRNKRNYPINYGGTQHKDCSYGRGIREIAKIMEGKGSKKKYAMGKMNFEFINKHGDKYKIPDSIIYPFISMEMLKFYSINYYEDPNYKFKGDDFTKYMNKNYSKIDISEFQIANNEFFGRKEELGGIRIGAIVNKSKKIIKKIIDENIE